ncbi:MAG: hypothetical protein WAW88_02160 [Nocardioides sp.]
MSLVAVLVLAGTGCTGDADGPAAGPSPSSSEAAAPEDLTDVSVGQVTGQIDPGAAESVAAEVGDLVDDYLDWAYLGDYPRTDWSTPAPGFTPRAQRALQRDLLLMTNAAEGADLTAVTSDERVVSVDVFAPRGTPAGATARYRVTFTTESAAGEQQRIARGRLILSPAATGGWEIVGYYAGEAS